MKKTLAYFALLAITALAFFLRVYKVNQIPPSLSWDEVSIGYNAYSILKTGRDEHQRFFPLDTFTAYGDYKPPLSIYATVPAVALFGLNEFAVRLPSVLAGTITVFLLFFVAQQLFSRQRFAYPVSLAASLLLAISPWHIQLSRGGFEANIAVAFIVMGIFLVLKAQEKPTLFLISWVPFVASAYTFNSARYFSPLIGIGLIVFMRRAVSQQKKLFAWGIVIAFILLVPLLPHLLSEEARLRFAEVNIFTDISVVKTANERMAYDDNVWWSKVFHNRRVGFVRSYLTHLFDNIEPWFLFIRGDGNPKFSIQDVGQLYLIELPFLIFGIYWTFVKFPRAGWLLLYWLIVAIVPAGVARETPHALRIENGLPVFILFLAIGIVSVVEHPRAKAIRRVLAFCILLLYAANVSYYLHNYYTHYSREFSGEWQYGYREALQYVKPRKSSYDQIVVTESIGRAYMYTLFYEQYDPVKYWQSVDASFDAAGFYHVYGFDTYRFSSTSVESWKPNTLYVLKPDEVPGSARILQTIYQLDGKPALVVFEL